jgi:hypothetical protein
MIAAGIASGHVLLADWLFLIAAILLLAAALIAALQRPDPSHGALAPTGLTLIAIAWLVL